LAETQNNVDVKTNTIIIVSQTAASNTVKNLWTLEMGLGQGTNRLIRTEMYSIDGSVIPETIVFHEKEKLVGIWFVLEFRIWSEFWKFYACSFIFVNLEYFGEQKCFEVKL